MSPGEDSEGHAPSAHLLPVGILEMDPQGRCRFLNSAGAQVLGIDGAEGLELGWMRPLAPADRTRILHRWFRTPASGEPFELELRLQGEGGGGRVISCRVAPSKGSDGTVLGHVAILLDITDWKRTELSLRDTTRELEGRVRELDCLFGVSKAIERNAGDLPAILGDTASVLSQSLGHPERAAVRITLEGSASQTGTFGSEPPDCIARILVHGREEGRIEARYPGRAGSGGGRLSPVEEQRLLETVAERLGRTAERLRGRRLLREKEAEMRERLTHLTRVSTMGEMASSIAHEVNQPLTAIATYAQACRRLMDSGAPQPPSVLDALAKIGEEALRAGNIIHRLKDMMRRQESHWVACDLNALIRDIEDLAAMDARLNDVVLRVNLEEGLPPILADGIQIQQVVLNLIRNGVDAVVEADPPVREVTVRSTRSAPREVRVSVDDTGIGLPGGIEDTLFEPFFTTKKAGMGMGLSISRSIAMAHHGQISFSRNSPSGTSFHLTLPVLDDV